MIRGIPETYRDEPGARKTGPETNSERTGESRSRTVNFPRFMIAAEQSGSGKTTLTCALLFLLRERGLRVHAFKCGPDYIDPMFHRRVLETPSYNLDGFFSDADMLRYLIGRHAEEAEKAAECPAGRAGTKDGGRGSDADACGTKTAGRIAVLEGVMGYYDGLGASWQASSYDVARITGTPVILVVDASGRSTSVLAAIKGFLSYRPDSGIRGVVLNRVSPSLYPALAERIREELGILPLGYLPKLDEGVFESRHLGLILPEEIPQFRKKVESLARQIEPGLDWDALLSIARDAPPLAWTPPQVPVIRKADGSAPMIAVAQDEAFCFYYRDNLELMERMGAKLVFFSPLHDAKLPEGIDGLYLGGGYPELHARELSENVFMRDAIRAALAEGLPCIAECGGYLYLTEMLRAPDGTVWPMTGFLPGGSADAGKLTHFGYAVMTAKRDGLLGPAGTRLRVHEFHRWNSDTEGDAFCMEKPSAGGQNAGQSQDGGRNPNSAWGCSGGGRSGSRSWEGGYLSESLYAGFPHLYFTAEQIAPFLRRAAKE